MLISEEKQAEILAEIGQKLGPCPKPHPYDFEPCFMCWGSGEADPHVFRGTCPRCLGYSVEPHIIVEGGYWRYGYGGTLNDPVEFGPWRISR